MYGAVRMGEEFPAFPPYVKPELPPNTPEYDDDADEDERREARAALDIERRDYAVVQGFIRGFQDNIQDAVESALFQDLEHIRFGFDNVWPKESWTRSRVTARSACQRLRRCRRT